VTDYTTIRLGETVSRRVVNPPNCVGDPWPCQYFRLTTTGAGMLIADLTFDSVTQQGQGVDLTIEDASGRRVWAQDFTSRTTRVMARVADMTEIQITLWYTYDDLQFELRTALELSSRVP
jgi:hypothetical protein